MEGTVTWPQATYIGGIIIASVLAGFVIAWRFWIVRSRDVKHCEEKIKALEDSVESRLASLEFFKAGTVVTLEHIKIFREEVQTQYERLREERKHDIDGINLRLDAIFNTVQMVKLRDKNSA